MRKYLLIILFIGFVTKLEAQSWVYHPFPTDSAIWTNAHGTWDVHPTSPPSATLLMSAPTRYWMTSADTVIGIETYSKIEYCGGVYRGALRDDGVGKIYFIPVDSISELLIYDFTVHSGDVVTVFENPGNSIWSGFTQHTYTIGSVDSILIGSSYRKRIYLDGQHWIEGIGCTNGLFTESWANVSNWYVNLDCMSSKDTTLYPVYGLAPCSLYSGINEEEESADIIFIQTRTMVCCKCRPQKL
jgi:hypothetical protein